MACSHCHKQTKAEALARDPRATIGKIQATAFAYVRVLCPHCQQPRLIPNPGSMWYCPCQICSCN